MEGNLNRRSFVKGAALSAAGLIAGGALAACSPAAGTSESKSDSAQTTGANNAEQRWSFEIAPDPIGDDLITETVETDVVVVGGGMSGLVAAASCAENGLKVTLISASKAPVSRGGSNNGVYSKIMEEMGIPRMDPTWFYRKEYLANGGNFKPALWYKFYNNSEEAINWIIDIAAKAGIKTTIESGPEYKEGDPMFTPPAAHAFYVDDSELKGSIGNGEGHIAAEMGRYVAEDLGVDVRWNVKGEQLVRGGVANGTEGRVDAIIASDADGAYTKYVGTKAVIMATGDFSHDKDMMERYCPQAVELCDFTTDINYDQGIWMGGLMPGDGHKMELWVGGAWQKEPNNIMLGRPNLPGDQPYTSLIAPKQVGPGAPSITLTANTSRRKRLSNAGIRMPTASASSRQTRAKRSSRSSACRQRLSTPSSATTRCAKQAWTLISTRPPTSSSPLGQTTVPSTAHPSLPAS